MKILVINAGSSSIKYQLFDMDGQMDLASGLAERIGETAGRLIHETLDSDGVKTKETFEGAIPDHHTGLERIVDLLIAPGAGVIQDKSEISAVGHRVVHGGESFHDSSIINQEVMAAIEENIPLAPLHNPPNLEGVRVAQAIFPDALQVAVFDTAFHQTLEPHAYMYALPYEIYEKQRVRRYGFHGTSHQYVAQMTAAFLKRPISKLKIITIHLGNGASMAAVKYGRCIDTSMGMTPLAGLVMGTRSGDIDPALPFFLADHLNLSLKEIDALLNKKSGIKGLCGKSDMREVLAAEAEGDERAHLALEVYTYRIKKYIGAYFAALGGLDAICFTAGIGENSPDIRRRCCEGLSHMGIILDEAKNQTANLEERDIGAPEAFVRTLVIPTEEELKIARETLRVVRAELGG